MTIIIAGCGALGSRIAIELTDHNLLLIDDDTVAPENIPTSAFSINHIGAPKSVALSDMVALRGGIARFTVEEIISARQVEKHAPQLIVDCLDNVQSRRLLCGLNAPTIHVGVSQHGWGSCVWDNDYTVRADGTTRGDNPICTHNLGAPILRATATTAVNVIERFLYTAVQENVVVRVVPIRRMVDDAIRT